MLSIVNIDCNMEFYLNNKAVNGWLTNIIC